MEDRRSDLETSIVVFQSESKINLNLSEDYNRCPPSSSIRDSNVIVLKVFPHEYTKRLM